MRVNVSEVIKELRNGAADESPACRALIDKAADALLSLAAELEEEKQANDGGEIYPCSHCRYSLPLNDEMKKYFREDCLQCALGRGEPNLGYSIVSPFDFCSGSAKKEGDAENVDSER